MKPYFQMKVLFSLTGKKNKNKNVLERGKSGSRRTGSEARIQTIIEVEMMVRYSYNEDRQIGLKSRVTSEVELAGLSE